MTCCGKRGEPVRITQEQTNVCTCPLAQAVIGARYEVFVYPQDDCPIHKPDCEPCERCEGAGYLGADEAWDVCPACNGTGVEP